MSRRYRCFCLLSRNKKVCDNHSTVHDYSIISRSFSFFDRGQFLSYTRPLQGNQLTKAGAVRCLRAQLARGNEFYGAEPAEERQLTPPPLSAEQQGRADERDPWGANFASTSKPTVYNEFDLLVQPADDDGYNRCPKP